MYDYGLTSEQFWDSTPAQLHAIGKRFDRDVERQEFGPALITSTVCRMVAGANVSPEDFMPSHVRERGDPRVQSSDQLKQTVMILSECLGGQFYSGKGSR